MNDFTDQAGQKVFLKKTPKRIVSLVPSQTELLYDLGLAERVVGITAYCVYPRHWLKEKTVIGGTKNLQIEKIKSLKPDLVIGNKEENVKEQVEALREFVPVWLSDVKTAADALKMIEGVGELTDTLENAGRINSSITDRLKDLKKVSMPFPAVYFIWKEPYMLASTDSFISSMMELCGLKNLITSENGRYPEAELSELADLDPKLILLSSEPYPFSAQDLHAFGKEFPNAVVKIVDGESFSWYGSRMLGALKYFGKIKSELNLLDLTDM